MLIITNVSSYIIPHHEYVALDDYQTTYIPITHDELINCFQINEHNLICRKTFPIMYTSQTDICEILLIKKNIISDHCNIRITNLTNEIWIHMKQVNSFIFVLPKEQHVLIKCEDDITTVRMSGTGVIQIKPHCEIKTDGIILSSFEVITTTFFREIRKSAIFNVSISDLINTAKSIEKFHIPNIMLRFRPRYIFFSLNLMHNQSKEIKGICLVEPINITF